MTEPRRPRRPGAAPVLWGSLALFAVLFALLTYQLSSATGSAPRQVVQRKVIKRRVVTTVVPSPEPPVETAPLVETAPPVEAAPPITTGAS